MAFVGEMLRRERLKSGLDLERISRETKIPERLLQAIEQEEFDKLPGRVFAISFVRQYAHTLGLDEDQVIADLREQQEPPPPPVMPCPEPPKRKSVQPVALAITAGVIVLLFAHAVWQRTQDPPDIARQEAPVSPTPAASKPAPGPLPVSPAVQPPASPAPMRLVLTANDTAWVAAKRDGRTVFAGVLKPNDTKALDGDGTYQLVIGNAGAVDVTLNGKPIGPLGPRRQTRDIQVTPPDKVQITPHKEPLQDIF